MGNTFLGLITARGQSQGLPRKNIRLVGGKPLIVWTIEAALGCRQLSRVIVSTDDDEIAQIAVKAGVDVPFLRPRNISLGDSPHVLAALHALDFLRTTDGWEPDYLVLLQPTSPLRQTRHIDQGIELILRHNAPSVIAVTETHSHPYLTRQMNTSMGELKDFLPCPLAYARRQNLPPAYFINGALFICRNDVLRREQTFSPQGSLGLTMEAAYSFQIDNAWDLALVDTIMSRGLLAAFERGELNHWGWAKSSTIGTVDDEQ